MGKVLVVTKTLPPMSGGTSFLLYELLKYFPKDQYVGVSGIDDPAHRVGKKLQFPCSEVRIFNNDVWTNRISRRFPKYYFNRVKTKIEKIVLMENIHKIYLHYPDGIFTVAGYQIAQKYNIPYVIYFDILWEERASGFEKKLAINFEKEIVTNSQMRFAISEFAIEKLTLKHNLEFIHIPHTIDSKLIRRFNAKVSSDRIKIHFAGGIYPQMNEDALKDLELAINELESLGVEVELCTGTFPDWAENNPNFYQNYYNKEDLIKAQTESDILFLPQAFISSTPEMIRNNFPTKTMEYLCSGRPILIYSPKTSYLSHLGRQHGFGKVVDNKDKIALSHAIVDLVESEEKQKKYVENGIKFVLKRDSRIWSLRLQNYLESI